MASSESNQYGNAGGWQVPGMPGMPPKKQKGNVWNDPLVQLGGGGGSVMGSNVPYAQNYEDDWNNFSERNKRRADTMIRLQKQGVPLDRIKALIDPDIRRYGMSGYNAGAAIKENQQNTKQSMVQPSLNPFENIWGAGETSAQRLEKTGGPPPEGAWYDDLWKGAKDLGLKGWGELGIGAMNAYTGWQEAEMAKKQHGLAQKTFDFQKDAYNKDREGRVLAYNTNAQNVNAWKEAQGRTDLNTLMV
jgi:hypothetical protein